MTTRTIPQRLRSALFGTLLGKVIADALKIVQTGAIWRLLLLTIGFALVELGTLFALREFLVQLLGLVASDIAVSEAQDMMRSPLVAAAAFMIGVFALRYFLSLFLWRRSLSIIMAEQVRITNALFTAYISRPYDDARNTEKSSPAQTIFLSATRMVHQFLLPLSMMMVELAVAITVGAALLFLEPLVSIAVVIWLIIFLGAIILSGRDVAASAGEKRWAALNQMRRLIDGAFGDLRVIRLSAAEGQFCARMDREAEQYASALIDQSTLDRRPIYARELTLAGTMIITLIALIATGRSAASIGEGLILFAAASVRLLPAIQRLGIFSQQLRGQAPDLSDLLSNLNIPSQSFTQKQGESSQLFEKAIELDAVSFGTRYDHLPILSTISLKVEKSKHISISGPSGAGKSTLLMLACGLIEPDGGRILIDDAPTCDLLAKIRAANVALVPQDSFIADMPILENMSFPYGPEDIDQTFAENTLKHFSLPNIAEGTLERVRRFSGGEKQRLAIARALCQQPELLLLDEATSQLDPENTRAVFNYIAEALPQTTVIVVSHQQVPDDLPITARYALENGQMVQNL